MVKTALQRMSGPRRAQFVEKLGERLAFERSGVRLYEALVSKFDAEGEYTGGPTRDGLIKILRDEYDHFRMLERAILRLGADPTVVTPSADFHGTLSSGILAVVTDPRTRFSQCLEAANAIELADKDCWEALIELARQANETELLGQFLEADAAEVEHLLNVCLWLAAAQTRLQDTASSSDEPNALAIAL